MGSADLHIQVGVADGVADLLESTACSKHGKRRGKGHQAGGRHTGSSGNHVGLSNTEIIVTVGVSLLEDSGLGSAGQVGIQNHQILTLGAQLNQSGTVAVTGSNFLHLSHITLPPVLHTEPSARS